jgi:hypothetical protein
MTLNLHYKLKHISRICGGDITLGSALRMTGEGIVLLIVMPALLLFIFTISSFIN